MAKCYLGEFLYGKMLLGEMLLSSHVMTQLFRIPLIDIFFFIESKHVN